MPRQQLPPQIKKITLKNGKVRYHVKENGRVDSTTKQRPKLDKRFDTEKEARDALRDFQYQTARGTYVTRSTLTVEQACANWLAGRHGLRKSVKAAYRNGLQPLRDRLHDARHTCGTLMHLEHNVPVAIISAWLGHADTAFTMRT
jgi:integrase